MDLELFVLECRAIKFLRRTSSLPIKLFLRRKMRRGSGMYAEATRGNDVARRRGDDATSWRQHRDDAARRGSDWLTIAVSVRRASEFRLKSLSDVLTRVSRSRRAKSAVKSMHLPVSGRQKPRSSVEARRAARPCAETHIGGRIASYGYGRTVGTDNTIDLRRLTALCCSSDSVVVASCAGRSPLFRLPVSHPSCVRFPPAHARESVDSRIYE